MGEALAFSSLTLPLLNLLLRTLKTKLPFFYLFSVFWQLLTFLISQQYFGSCFLLEHTDSSIVVLSRLNSGSTRNRGKRENGLVCLPFETFALSLLSVSDSPRGFLPLSSSVNIRESQHLPLEARPFGPGLVLHCGN